MRFWKRNFAFYLGGLVFFISASALAQTDRDLEKCNDALTNAAEQATNLIAKTLARLQANDPSFSAGPDSKSVADRLIELMLQLKTEEMRHEFDYIFPERGKELVTLELTARLLANPAYQRFQLAAADAEALTQFYVNELRQNFLSLEQGRRIYLAQTLLLNAGFTTADRETVRMLAQRLEQINHHPQSLLERMGRKDAQNLLENFRLPTNDEVRAFVEIYTSFRANQNALRAETELEAFGLRASEAERTVADWQSGMKDNRCCVSTPGCRTCPLNRSFLP